MLSQGQPPTPAGDVGDGAAASGTQKENGVVKIRLPTDEQDEPVPSTMPLLEKPM